MSNKTINSSDLTKALIAENVVGVSKLIKDSLSTKVKNALDIKEAEIKKTLFRSINEDVLDKLQKIQNGVVSNHTVKFKDGTTMQVDRLTATAIMQIYKNLSGPMREKLQRMVNANPVQMMKVVDFAYKKTRG